MFGNGFMVNAKATKLIVSALFRELNYAFFNVGRTTGSLDGHLKTIHSIKSLTIVP